VDNTHPMVISGIGLAVPMGCELQTCWQTLCQGEPLFSHSIAPGPAYQTASIATDQLVHGLSGRQTQKLDRFTLLSMTAARQALLDANLVTDETNRDSLGIAIGNSTGGWGYLEPMVHALYTEGMEAINPYVATAWFPTASQGEISILHKIGGYSKTVSAEQLSAGFALDLALRVIRLGRVEAMLVGGAESPLNAPVLNAYRQSGQLSPSGRFQPFHRDADGRLLGEGAALFVVEPGDRAVSRGVTPYGEVLALGKGMSLVQAIWRCLRQAAVPAEEIDYLILDASGDQARDDAEYRAIGEIFAANAELRMSAPRSLYGDLIGADMAVDVVLACLSLKYQEILPTVGTPNSLKMPPVGKHIVGHSEAATIRYVLINGRDEDGQSLAILLGKSQSP
jgi:3-oxoacyl-[acyl-carrier-protein] synthase II